MKQLRQQAEAKLKRRGVVAEELSEYDNQRLLHELHTHQIELELQNDELRRTQQALQESHDRYADLYNSAPIGYVTLDKEGGIIDANIKFAQMLNLASVELIQKPLSDFVVSEDQDTLYLLRQRLRTTKSNQSCELRLQDATGEQHWVRIDCNAAIVDGDISQIRASISDISSLKQTEQLLQQSRLTLENRMIERTVELEKAQAAAEQACQSKTNFLSFMTHELHSPMNSIIGFAQLLERQINNEQKEMAASIISSGNHMLSSINDLLDLSRIESGLYEQDIQTVDLIPILHDSLSAILPMAQQQQIQIHDAISPLNMHYIKADPRSLKQALLKLISNAVKYAHPGGKITLSCRNLNGIRIRICVTYNGRGIAKEDIEKIFSPFNRLDENLHIEGTGVGLAITRKLVEMMGGVIGVESTLDKGSTFWIELDNATRA